MATYSAFFSSGLLAPHNSALTNYGFNYYDEPSPATPSSPLPIPDDSDIEIDTEREETPTPDLPSPFTPSFPAPTVAAPTPTTAAQAPAQPRPRLRKRRSSLTVGTSPMNAIRSPMRTAGAALQLQLHLPTSPSRSRSGSLNSGTSPTDVYGGMGMGNIASEGTSLVGRMRSGSVGTGLRPRRVVRRLASVPAPAPPPTAPLPAIPACMLPPTSQMKCGPPLSAPLYGSFAFTPQHNAHVNVNTMNIGTGARLPLATRRSSSDVVPMRKGRDRSFSVIGAGYRIDEEMKEN